MLMIRVILIMNIFSIKFYTEILFILCSIIVINIINWTLVCEVEVVVFKVISLVKFGKREI